jgi:UDP-N-acetyl-D-mannosaminuronic acid transferase (WecB/TagA/CpsF family)
VNQTIDEAIAHLQARMAAFEAASLFFVNAHTLNLAAADPGYRRLLNASELVFGDGTGITSVKRV